MQPDSQPHVDSSGPGTFMHCPLDRERGLECCRGTLEDREEVVRASIDLATTGATHRGAHETADVGEQRRVELVEASKQLGGALEVGQQKGDVTFRQLPLRLQLCADEADRNDAVLPGRSQEPRARAVARTLVLERHLAEPCKGVPHVRGIVDRQPAPAGRVDVRERAVGKLRALLGA